ncbi:MAG: ribosome small subunit-dependent GTPase A, partial [Bacillota bacterium]
LEVDKQLQSYPYPTVYTSAITGTGITELKEKLKNKCSVFAGPSGVGKSTLLNTIQPGLSLRIGTVSDKIKRGRHTTRQAELLPLDHGGTVVDTPGFTRLDFSELSRDELACFFPEFAKLSSSCGFRDCRHLNEPRCAVREAVGKSINPMRYEHYRYFANELNQQEVY